MNENQSRLTHPDLEPITSSEQQPDPAPAVTAPAVDPTAQWRDDLNRTMQQMARTQELLAQQISSQQQNNHRSAFMDLEQTGIQPHIMKAAIEEIVGPEVQRRVGEALQPLAMALQAEAAMEQQFPEFRQSQPKVMKFIQEKGMTDRFQRLVAADPQGAMEWAVTQYERSMGPAPRTSAADDSDAARIPKKTSGSNSRTTAPDDQEEIKNGYELYRRDGDVRPLLRARFRSILPDSHFTQQ